jgi:Photosynthesis system II assembly factor YCF48
MTDLRQIVRERLRVAGPAGHHPDADVLTAFAEQALPAKERTGVLEHVSRCRDCREVLALATPAQEAAVAAAVPSGVSRGWLRWPALRWGAAAACFVVVGAAVLLQRNFKADRYASLTPSAMKVSDEKQIAEEKGAAVFDLATQKPAVPGPARPASTPSSEAKDLKADAVKRISPSANSANLPSPSMKTGVVGGLAPTREQAVAEADNRAVSSKLEQERGERVDYLFSQKETLQSGAAPAPAPPSATPAQASSSPAGAGIGAATGGAGQAASAGTVGRLMAKKQVPGRAKPSPVLDQDKNSEPIQGVGEPKETVEVTGVPVVMGIPMNGRNVAPLVPRWTLSAEGQLQRSLDSGKTWETVPVGDNSSLSLVSAEATTNYQEEMRAHLSDKAKAGIKSSSESGPPKFRALSANGNDVWVGGTAGLLYHSTDAGTHWTKVMAVAEGVTLTADIVTLDFADAQHGKLVASTGETWVTTDGGKNWKKQ